ncbi:MAG TPA: hypothetical protein ENH15_05380 [Actinobacteria bacterium]|nr:hypothetical protein [Actinomycetota bacterium]
MGELAVRFAVVAAVGVGVWLIARRSAGARHEWPKGVLSGPGIFFFSSRTCDSCHEVRLVLDDVVGDDYREIAWEDDPDGWVAFGVDSVPTAVLVDRRGVVLDDLVGLPESDSLAKWRRRLKRM